MTGNLRMYSTGLLVFVLSLVLAACQKKSEHPTGQEHPTNKSKEHPQEPPKKSSQAEPITKESLAEQIQAYVEREVNLKGGYFLVYDQKSSQPLALKLKQVHKNRLSPLGNDVYFACADFETPEGKIYDLDIFMQGADAAELGVTEVAIHKEAGQPRYDWYEEAGVWKKRAKE